MAETAQKLNPTNDKDDDRSETAAIGIMAASDTVLGRNKARLFKGLVKRTTSLDRTMQKVLTAANRELDKVSVDLTQTRISTKDARRIVKAIDKEMVNSLRIADGQIQRGVDAAIRGAQNAQVKKLKSLGLDPPTPKELKAMRNTMVREFREQKFPPGSSVTYKMRMEKVRREHMQQMKQILGKNRRSGHVLEMIQKDLKSGLMHTKLGKAPIRGGSLVKKVRGLMLGEEGRAMRQTEVDTMRVSGVALAYWRLNPAHKWHGSEVCELHATSLNSDAISAVARFDAGISVQGLYRVDNIPAYPHPYCMCYMEPAYTQKYASALESAVAAGAAVVVNDDLLRETAENRGLTNVSDIGEK